MRILHTSDWHLGQYFITKSRAAEHQAFISWLLCQVSEQEIDALIIAGDLFDTGAPPSYARELYNRFVVDLNRLGCQLVVLAGNHDSVATLGESRELLACLNTQVIPKVSDDPGSQLLVLKDARGEPGAILCAVPYIRPRDVMKSRAGESGDEKQQALGEAIAEHYQRLYQLAQELRESYDASLPIIATGHLTAMGVSCSESVRDIYVGTLEAFPASLFPAFDYIALGHIHRPQRVGKTEHIRYSGSPIPLSFDELGSQKQLLVVEFTGGKLSSVEPLNIPCFQPMQVIRGSLAKIEHQLEALDDSAELALWLSIEVQGQEYLHDLQQRISAMIHGRNLEILQLRRARERSGLALQQTKEVLTELKPHEVFEKRLALESFETEDELRRRERLCHTFSQILNQLESREERA
ncbi:exonuclease subunit SbcD [Dongshaea marina]|uniref:exonuclease subunit SbcD n=1 Tax=Dongshaea marina TaxID=2047966 RepID=UPI000D3EA4A7|nr:exonuclease subunit SbcD [Dongshaea marina]